MTTSAPGPGGETRTATRPGVHEWVPALELYLAAHHWRQIMLFCLIGALAGLALSFAWPAPYQATQELYVGLDMLNASAEAQQQSVRGLQFANLNDFKNWQMADLNGLILTDATLSETLSRLRQQDPAWQQVSQQELAAQMNVYWRNAGKWRLVVQNRDPQRATQAVNTWQEVVVEQVGIAVAAAQRLRLLESSIQSTSREQASLVSQMADLNYLSDRLKLWQTDSADLPPEAELDKSELELLTALASTNAQLNGTLPAEGSPRGRYRKWARQAQTNLDEALISLQTRHAALDSARQQIQAEVAATARTSLGISSGMLVQRIDNAPPAINTVRPTGLLILIGACLGLITWIFLWLTRAGG